MRSGAYTVQQTLTAEAASVLKHSLGLARRRGHGQVTPLHVAATLLSSTSSLLRSACIKSRQPQQAHQCRALELCFNVALNRLPTAPSLFLHGQPASLSNALVAALKRAQAHQRRGCIEQQQQQQQPLLTIKVELEQLIVSILDDPSVSRVMREAGFSSTTVKNNIEEYSSAKLVASEVQWAVQAVPDPSGGLGLSLHASSVHDSQGLEMKPFAEPDKLTCCEECALNYEKDVRSVKSSQQKLLPPWLQPHGANNASQKDEMLELRRKWNRLCHSLHQVRHNQNHLSAKDCHYASSYPLWPCRNNIDSTSKDVADSHLKLSHSVPKFRRQNLCTIEFDFGNGAPNLDSLKTGEDEEMKITLALGNSLFSNSQRAVKETNELCKLLQDNVPWQSRIIRLIAEDLKHSESLEKHTWLMIQGNDVIGKRRLAGAIAESVLGSADLLLHMNMRCNEATSCYERLVRAFRNKERLVVLVENVDLADTQFLKLLADEFETETEGRIGQAIFILTKSICSSYKDCRPNQDSVIEMKMDANEKSNSFGTTASDNKRKAAEWDVSNKIKASRISLDKDSSRQQPSCNSLDLNMKADEDDQSGDTRGDSSPISSDITRETAAGPRLEIGFLESIRNRYIMDRSAAQDKEMKGVFMSKMKRSVEATFGGDNVISFSVEDKVLDGISFGSSYFLNSLFDKWLKDIFQRGLETVKIGGKDGIREIRLSYGGIRGNAGENGFMGTCLPGKIQVPFMG
ncbi:hypothetical protein V6N13_039179 [Hibiscus sabdariffa]|uniref:Clp R domain-containing protein n=1 Tax=Hibiscus sabdariffa TaxID=183260 RepID=A0ABR2SWA0_9ROSI